MRHRCRGGVVAKRVLDAAGDGVDRLRVLRPRPALLIAGGGLKDEIPTNAAYRDAGWPSVRLWALPEAGHTAGCAPGRPSPSAA